MIRQIDHIGIAVADLEDQLPFYRDVLKLEFNGFEELPDQKVKVAIFSVGNVQIELLEPTADDSPIARFIAKKGTGIHHIAYRTDDIRQDISQMIKRGVQMIDERPRQGAHGSQIAFLHPKSSGKVLTELCQPKGDTHE